MQIIKDIHELREALSTVRTNSRKISFVPTMGNLHQGHLDLISHAKQLSECTVVSIFVNPLQFGAGGDFESYPRTFAEDCEKLQAHAVSYVFYPDAEDIYPYPVESMAKVSVPHLSDVLCGKHRSGHFDGVTTVVAKLFNIVDPDIALFGEKDYQQLQIIRKMVLDLNMRVNIEAVATRREEDGLAMSSRNRYLNKDERKIAPGLLHMLNGLKQQINAGEEDFRLLEKSAVARLSELGFRPDYVSLLEPEELSQAQANSPHIRAFVAAYLGEARLIDNIQIR